MRMATTMLSGNACSRWWVKKNVDLEVAAARRLASLPECCRLVWEATRSCVAQCHPERSWRRRRPRTGLFAHRAKPREHAWVRIACAAVGPEGQVVPQQQLVRIRATCELRARRATSGAANPAHGRTAQGGRSALGSEQRNEPLFAMQ